MSVSLESQYQQITFQRLPPPLIEAAQRLASPDADNLCYLTDLLAVPVHAVVRQLS